MLKLHIEALKDIKHNEQNTERKTHHEWPLLFQKPLHLFFSFFSSQHEETLSFPTHVPLEWSWESH